MRKTSPFVIGFLIVALLIGARLVHAAPAPSEATPGASQEDSAHVLLLDVTLNGVAFGVLPFLESQGKILIPEETARQLRIRPDQSGPLDPDTIASAKYLLNLPQGSISLDIPASHLTTLTLG